MIDPVAPPREAVEAPGPVSLDQYADLAVRVGVNLQVGQTLYIRAPIEAVDFVRRVVARAYGAGARHVHVDWEDEQLGLLRYRLAPQEALTEYPEWKAHAMQQLAEAGAAFLTVSASDPDLLRDVDAGRVATANRAMMSALAGWYRLIGAMRTPWTIVAVPTAGWSAKVFPDQAPAARAARLWACILEAVRVDGVSDPVEGWRRHLAELGARAAAANRARFRALHYRGPGTDLRVELPAGHRWLTSPVLDRRGIAFVPNLPTEEIFTLPARTGVEGTVRATLPLNYRGVTVEGLALRFEGGRVVEATARAGQQTLQRLLDTDDGARRLGEVALVPEGSAVSRLHTLFYHTLFDENAACHLALGRAYPTTLEGGDGLDAESLRARGANTSLEHVDFMIGSAALDVDGITAEGTAVPLLRAGRWAGA